jgi:hypothetical protein
MDTTDIGMSPFIMGVTNVVTAYLPVKWSRWFPLIPIALGAAYAFLTKRAEAGATGPGAIALYSLVRNAFGTKPKDAK